MTMMGDGRGGLISVVFQVGGVFRENRDRISVD